MPKNYYLILGIKPGASPEDIKMAYRKRARQVHPDHSGLESGPFVEVQEAYSVLGDPARRRVYDKWWNQIHRREGARAAERPEPVIPHQKRPEPLKPKPADLGEYSLGDSFWSYNPSCNELFDRLLSNFNRLERPKDETIRSLTVELRLTPEQAARGGQAKILVPAQAACPTCQGHGFLGHFGCARCGGEGVLSGEYPMMIHFPAGVRDGYQLRLPLNSFGIRNFYLVLHFRVTMQA